MAKIKAFFFWPLLILAMCLAVYVIYQRLADGRPRPSTPAPFELIVRDVVKQTGNIELVDVSFEHWQKQSISTSILKPGPLGALVKQYIPDAVMRNLTDQGWNQSSAEIITSCTASVEFEIPMDDPNWGKITIDGDVATIIAPPPVVSDINIRPETLKGWVLREDFLIDGEKEKERLLRQIRANLRRKVDSSAFHAVYREQCRSSLVSFFKHLFTHSEGSNAVNHVYVRFIDEPDSVEKH